MKRPRSLPVWLLAAAALTVTTLAPALAAEKPLEEVHVSVLPGAVSFDAAEAYESLTLTVGEPRGKVTRTTAEVAASLSFELVNEEGAARADGLYTYELRGKAEADGRDVLLRSGFFSVLDGAFVSPDLPEESFEKDLMHLDDVIVAGSMCVGLDCVNGESFGSTTLRLKENNTWIEFDDTSTLPGFADTDWELRANESDNGGADKFSIMNSSDNKTPFTILADAPTNAVFVDGDGDLGLGTSVPEKEIHTVDGDAPALRLEQDGSGSFTPQTWDVGGHEQFFFIHDDTANTYPFKIVPGAPTDALVVDAGGDVGLGTNTPAAKLDVDGDVVLTGTVDGRDVAADGATLDAHVADLANPHQVTASQVGAVSQAALDTHTGDLANPHQVTAAQAGADPAGTGASEAANAVAGHLAVSNPHGISTALIGADPAGTGAAAAAAAVAGHETAFNHGNLPSALPVPVAEGGTGATDAAAARANLGIADDPTKAGIVAAASFAGNPATAAVVFATPYPAATSYVVLLTAATSKARKTFAPSVLAKDETGFTITLGGKSNKLVEVSWLARPVGE